MKIVIDVPEKTYNRFCQCYRFPDEVEEAIIAITDGTPLPQPFDLEGLKSDIKALNCGFPYGLDYLLDCLNRRLGIAIIETDKTEGSDKE